MRALATNALEARTDVTMASITSQSIQGAIASAEQESSQAKQDAEDAIVAWRGEGKVSGEVEDLSRLYLALKKVQKNADGAGKKSRVTPQLLNQWKHSIRREIAISRGFYIDEKMQNPSLDAEPKARKYG